MERSNTNRSWYKKILEQRIGSSFIAVMIEEMEKVKEKLSRWLIPKDDISSAIEEVGRPSNISPNKLSYLLFPKGIWDQYKDKQIKPANLKVKIVEDSVRRELFDGVISLLVPDYESTIVEILREQKEPIWIHGVRLPNEADLSQSSILQVAPSKI